jgi:hypothetical protein
MMDNVALEKIKLHRVVMDWERTIQWAAVLFALGVAIYLVYTRCQCARGSWPSLPRWASRVIGSVSHDDFAEYDNRDDDDEKPEPYDSESAGYADYLGDTCIDIADDDDEDEPEYNEEINDFRKESMRDKSGMIGQSIGDIYDELTRGPNISRGKSPRNQLDGGVSAWDPAAPSHPSLVKRER